MARGGGLFLLIIFSIVGIGFSGFSVPIEDNATLQVSVAEYKNLDLSEYVSVGDITVFDYGINQQTSTYAIDGGGKLGYEGSISFPVTFQMRNGVADFFTKDENGILGSFSIETSFSYTSTDGSTTTLFDYLTNKDTAYTYTYDYQISSTSGVQTTTSEYLSIVNTVADPSINSTLTFTAPGGTDSSDFSSILSITFNVEYNFDFTNSTNAQSVGETLANFSFTYKVMAP